ncbi:MAG: hypothetical protein EA419_00230 [Wenzhouxiangella sp.]|nr:MAG: hypothetical protein EA419_00230 [Wenzhouxiangella sp.]
MINRAPFWRRPGWVLVLVLLAVAAGSWLALDRPLPESWQSPNARPEIRLPESLRRSDPDRLFCAESPETGICRCITSAGERPEISDAECRRRARGAETRAH